MLCNFGGVLKLNRKINVYLMYIIVFLQGFVFYGPIATIYRQNRGLSMSSIFLIESISWVLMIIFEIPWGWFSDKFGYKKTLVISNFLFFISKIIFYKAYSFEMFFLERVLLSLSISGLSGCDTALIYSSIEDDESEKIFGRYNAFSTVGFLIASLVSSFLVKYSMDSTAFWTIIPYGLAAILTLFIKDTKIEHEKKPKLKQSLLTALKNKNIIILVLSAALISEVVQAVSVFLNQSQYLRSGIDIKYFGILTAVMQIVCLSSVKAYKLSNKLGKNKSIQILYMIISICCTILVFTSNAALTILSIILLCGSASIISPIILDIENKSITTMDRATLLSVYAMCGDLIGAGANIIIGKTADISTPASFITCTIMCLCAYILFIVYKRKVTV